MLAFDSSMFSGRANRRRTPPEARGVEARAHVQSRSTTATRQALLRVLRWYAAHRPIAPPPMMTTSCCADMAALPQQVIVHLRRHLQAVTLGDATAPVAQIARQPSGPGVAQLLDQVLDPVEDAVAEAPGIDQQQELPGIRGHRARDIPGVVLE